MTDAKHRAQEAAGEVWERSDANGLVSERIAIVAFMREAVDQGYRSHPMTCEHDKYRWEMCVDCYDAHLHAKLDAVLRGDHLKGDVA